MLNHHSLNLNKIGLRRSTLRLGLFFALLYLGLFTSVYAQDYGTCGRSEINFDELIKLAFGAGYSNGAGVVVDLDGLSIDDKGTPGDYTDDVITGWNPGGDYEVELDFGSGQVDLDIKETSSAPSVVLFDHIDGDSFICPATDNYKNGFDIRITGGEDDYDIEFSTTADGLHADKVHDEDKTEEIHDGNTNLRPNIVHLVSVVDKYYCSADLTGINDLIYTTGATAVLDVSGSPVPSCESGVGLTLSLDATAASDTPENGVEYELQRDKDGNGTYEDVALSTFVGDGSSAISFPTQNVAGTYRVVGKACAGDLPMSNVYTVDKDPDLAFTVTGTDACSDVGTIIGLSDSELGIDYQLHDGTGLVAGTNTAGTNGAISFPNMTTPGTYKVVAISGCGTFDMDGGATVTIYTPPLNRPITTATACETSNTSVQLLNSESGISYKVYKDNVDLGEAAKVGTGGTLTWGPYTGAGSAGVYTVKGGNPGCTDVVMGGTVTIEADVTGLNIASSLVPPLCAGTPVTFNTVTSETDVGYTLYRNYGMGSETLIQTVAGDAGGNDRPFNPQSVAGIYTVVASKNGVCEKVMNNTFTINPSPDVSTITFSASGNCEGTPITITLSNNTEAGVNYNLLYDDGSGPVATAYSVGGNPGANPKIVTDQLLALGTYTIEATNGFCTEQVSGSVSVIAAPTDINFNTSGYVCNVGNIVLSNPGQSGVKYTLYKNGAPDASYLPIDGNGINTVQFNGLVPATYSVVADNGTCTTELTHKLIVEKRPDVQTVTIPEDNYCEYEAGVVITLADTETNVEYVLVDDTGTDVVSITGDGHTRDFTGVTAGTYTLEARSQNASCSLNLLTTAKTIIENLKPNGGINNLPGDFCEDSPPVTLLGSPQNAGGVWSGAGLGVFLNDNGDGTATFSPGAVSTPGTTYNITYSYTDGNGCVNSWTEGATVHANSINGTNLEITLLDNSAPDTDYCETSLDVNIKARLLNVDIGTADAVFSGPGITDNGDGTAVFSPSTAGLGNHSISLSYLDPVTTCSGNTSLNVTVGVPLTLPVQATYCANEGSVSLLGNETTGKVTVYKWVAADGDYTNELSTGPADGSVTFNPSVQGAGRYRIDFEFASTNCTNVLQQEVEVLAMPDATFLYPDDGSGGEQNQFCVNNADVDLRPNVASGFFSLYDDLGNLVAAGVDGKKFSPAGASPGDYDITYQVTQNGCTSIYMHPDKLSVVDLPSVEFSGLQDSYCENDVTPQTITINTLSAAGTGVFSSTKSGVLNPFVTDNGDDKTAEIDVTVGPGNYTVRFVYTDDASGCSETISKVVEVFDPIPVTFSDITSGQKICTSSGDINLNGSGPSAGNGNFSIVGGYPGIVDATADDEKAVLSPSLMTPGFFTVRYEYESVDGCITAHEITIEIVGTPTNTYSVTGGGAFCMGDAGITVGLGGSNKDVEYELLLDGNSFSPTVKYLNTTTGGAFNFTVNTDGSGGDRFFDSPGNYTVRANYAGCTSYMTGSVDIERYELVLQLDSKTDVSCKGASDGVINLKTGGGSGSYLYSADGSTWQASPTFSGLNQGVYSFSVKNAVAPFCQEDDVLTVNIDEPVAALSVTEDLSKNIKVGCTSCTMGGTCEGSATIVIAGGTPFTDLVTYPSGYNITWPAGIGAAQLTNKELTANNLAVATYSVLVEDAEGCSQTVDVTISKNTALGLMELDPAANHVDNLCFGGTDGEFVVQASGGSGDYQFSIDAGVNWLNSNRVNTNEYIFTNLSAGSYTILVRDKNYSRCEFTMATDVVITQPTAGLSLAEISNTQATCFGAADGSFTVQAAGGNGTYAFSEVNPAVAVAGDWTVNGTNEYTVSGVAAGNHSVWVRDAGATSCTEGTVVVTVGQPVELALNTPVITHVTCNSGTDGTVTLTGVGGSGNYVYSMDAGLNWQASNVFTGLSANIPYSFSIAESSDVTCQSLDVRTVTLTEPSAFAISEVAGSHKNVSCFTGADGEFAVTTSGGVGPFEYRVHDGTNYITTWDAASTFTGYAVGTYEISVRDRGSLAADFCEQDRVLSITITEPASAISILTEKVIDADCHGTANGSINITLAGATPPYKYQWIYVPTGTNVPDLDNGKTANPKNLLAGDYRVDVEDNNGCTFNKIYTVGEPTALNLVTDNITDVTCNSGSNGVITVIASGGSGTYQFNVDGGGYNAGDNAATFTESGLSAGNHAIWVRDSKATGCEYKMPTFIKVDEAPILDLIVSDHTHVSCNSNTDGFIELTASGGSGNYDYSKDGGTSWVSGTSATHTFTLLGAATYDLVIRDKNDYSCTKSISFEITEPSDFVTTVSNVTPVLCYGESTGEIELSTTGGVGPFEYSLDGSTGWQSSPIQNLTEGTYDIYVRDMGTTTLCQKDKVITGGVTIAQPASELTVSAGIELITDVKCNGELNGEINLQNNVTGGETPYKNYTWYKVGTTADVIQGQGATLKHITGLGAGEYYVVVEDDNGCTVQSTPNYKVKQPDAWDVDYTLINLTKYNSADGVINVYKHDGANTGHSISWYDVTDTEMVALAGTWTVSTFDAGTYRFKITDDNTCLYESPYITLTQPFEFIVKDPDSDKINISCYGGNDGFIPIQVESGSSNYNIKVSATLIDASVFTAVDEDFTTDTYDKLIGLKAGTYDIEVTDKETSEVYYSTVVLTQTDELSVSVTPTDITCNGEVDGILSVDIEGHIDGATISWTADNGYAMGPENLDVAIKTYSKSGLQAGNYTVTVNNNNGCSPVQVTPITISEPNPWMVSSGVTNVTSYGHTDGSITVNAPTGNTPPYIIAWSDGGTGWSRSGLTVGDYTYTITDGNGAGTCTYSETLTVSGPNQLLFDVTATDAGCYGSANGSIGVLVNSGNPNYNIALTGIDYLGTTVNESDLGNTSGNHVFDALTAGAYEVVITDSEGESLTKVVTINQLAEISVVEVSSKNITCYDGHDGEIEVAISGRAIDEANSTVNWTRTNPVGWSTSGAFSAEKSQVDLYAGTYTISVKDKNGCDAMPLSVVLTKPADITSSIVQQDHVTANGASDGRILIDAVSENGVKSIVWYKQNAGGTYDVYENPVGTPVTGVNNNGIEAGVYQYVITDNNDCTFTSSGITITEPGELVVNVSDVDVNCYGGEDGEILVTITSGNAPYSIELTGTPDDGSVFAQKTSANANVLFEDLKPGIYEVVVADHASQTHNETITISENDETTVSGALTQIECKGQGGGKIQITLGGRENGTETWSVINPNNITLSGSDITAIAAKIGEANADISGDYQVVVTNQDGCLIENTYTITEPVAWDVHHNVTHITPTGNNNGSIEIDVLSGNTPDTSLPEDYKITWSGPAGVAFTQNERLQTGLIAGTYSYQIEDLYGCLYDSGDIIINEPTALSANVTESSDNMKCYGDEEGEILVTVLAGNEPYTVVLAGNEYDGGAFSSTQTIIANTGSYLWDTLKDGEYQVQITDNVGNVFAENAIMISQPAENIITPAYNDLTCHAADKGGQVVSIQLNRNFVAIDKVTWTGPSGIIDNGALDTTGDTDAINVYSGGDYTYTFVDGNGCAISNTITIAEPDPFTIVWDDEDATIYNKADGIIDVHTYSGNSGAPYTISWADDAAVTTFRRDDLLAGSYSFTITDASGCDTTITDIFIGQPYALDATINTSDVTCYGGSDGEIEIEFNAPNNGGIKYTVTGNTFDGNAYDSGEISATTLNQVVSDLFAGVYEINAYDAIGTVFYQNNIEIKQDAEVTLIAIPKDNTCFGQGDGSITVSLSGRAPAATDIITWSGSNGTFVKNDIVSYNSHSVSKVEDYVISLLTAKGCMDIVKVEVEEPNQLIISVDNVQDVTCPNGDNGIIETSVSGRSGGSYQYDWYKHDGTDYQIYKVNGAATLKNPVVAGDYRLKVTSLGDGCEVYEDGIIVEDGSQIVINETIGDVTTCFGDNSGSVSVNVTGGTAPYTINCTGQTAITNNGSSASVFDNLTAGNYIIEVTDIRAACSSVTKSVVVSEPTLPVSVNITNENIDCDPMATTSGALTFEITGGIPSGATEYDYKILIPEASIVKTVTIPVGSTHTENVTGLSAGDYELTVLDLNSTDPERCKFNYPFTLQHIEISGTINNTSCKGVTNGEITGITIEGASSNIVTTWSSVDGLGIDNTSLDQAGLSEGTYVLTVEDVTRGCTVTKEFIVGVKNAIHIKTYSVKDVSCNGGSDGAINLVVEGAVNPTYTWSGPGIVNSNLQNQVDLITGQYDLTVEKDIDGETCQLDTVFTVAQPNPITYTASFENTACDPYERTLKVENINGGSGIKTILWNGPDFTPAVPVDPANVPIYKGGSYIVTVKDKKDCEVSKNLFVPYEISVDSIVTHVTCTGGYNGSIQLTINGGSGLFSVDWTGPASFDALANKDKSSISDLYAGHYTVVITDQNITDGIASCSKTYEFDIEEDQAIVITEDVIHPTCNGNSNGSIDIVVSGGAGNYNYQWSPVVGANLASNKKQENLPADTYTVLVTDGHNCAAQKDITLTEDAPIVLNLDVTETKCEGTSGEIDLTATGGSGDGFEYTWSSMGGTGLTIKAEDQTGLSGGTYSVIVKDLGDGRSCTATASATITDAISIINKKETDVTCLGNSDGSITYDVIGGDGNYKFEWKTLYGDDTRLNKDQQNQSGLSIGEYEVTITDTRLDPDGADCAITETFIIEATNELIVNVAIDNTNLCFNEPGATLTASVTGGSGIYSYDWNDGAGTNSTLANQKQGTHKLVVTDNNGCSYTGFYDVEGPTEKLKFDDVVITNVLLCHGDDSGEILVSASGGTQIPTTVYNYSWVGNPSTPVGNDNPKGLLAGEYTVTVTDNNGCTIDTTVYITEPTSRIKVDNDRITHVSAPGLSDGVIEVDVYDGVPPYSLQWYKKDASSVYQPIAVPEGTANPLKDDVNNVVTAGTYQIIATDNNGCTAELAELSVVEPGQALSFDKVVYQIRPCSGDDNGQITIRPKGGHAIGGTHYRIRFVGNGIDRVEDDVVLVESNLSPGIYQVTVTDDLSSTYSENIEIFAINPLELDVDKLADVSCFGGGEGVVEVTVGGGLADASGNYFVFIEGVTNGYYNEKLDAKDGASFTFTGLPAGEYNVIVRDHADDTDTHSPDRGYCDKQETVYITEPGAEVSLSANGSAELCRGEVFTLAVTTLNWDFSDPAYGNIKVDILDNYTTLTTTYTIDNPLVEIPIAVDHSRTYKIAKVYSLTDATCLKGEDVGNSVQVTVHDLPSATITGPSEVCEDGAVTLNIVDIKGRAPFDITWADQNNGTSGTITIHGNDTTLTDSPVGDGKYVILNVSDANGCSNAGTGAVDVIINKKPIVTLTGSDNMCVGDSRELIIGFNQNKGPYTITYLANGKEGSLVVTPDASLSYSWTVAPDSVTTDYVITQVVDANSCEMDMTAVPVQATITLNPVPTNITEIKSDDDDDGIVCQGTKGVAYYIDDVDYETSYHWDADAGINIITSADANKKVTVNFDRDFDGGYIRVYAKNDCGVNNTVERWITADPIPDPITVAPVGDTDVCQGTKGLVYSINQVDNASAYEWDLPTGMIIQGDGTGSSIVVDLDPNIPSNTDMVRVRPVNDCSASETWSPGLEVTITPLPMADAGSDDRVCGTVTALNAVPVSGSEDGEWEIVGGSAQFVDAATDKTRADANIYNLSQGENVFVWTVTNKGTLCSVTDTVKIFNDQLTVNAVVENSPVCGGTATISGTPVASLEDADEGYWNIIAGGGTITDGTLDNTTVTGLDKGVNTVTWTVRKGSCESTAQVNIVNNEPTEPVIYNASDVIVNLVDLECQTDFTTLRGSTPEAYESGYWRIESGKVSIDNKYNTTINITNIGKGDHVLSWNILNGDCLSKTIVEIRNNALEVDAGVNSYTCDGTINLTGTEIPEGDGVTGVWTYTQGFANFSDAAAGHTAVSELSQENDGVNILRWTMTRNGCASYDTVIISNDEPSQAQIQGLGTSDQICGFEYDLHAVPEVYGDGYWSLVSGQGNLEDATDPFTKVTNLAVGDNKMRWTVTKNTCSSSVDFTITNLHVDTYAGADTAVCEPVAKLNATPAPDGATGTWSVVSSMGSGSFFEDNESKYNGTVESLASGNNTLVWTVDYNGCVSTDTMVVTNNQPTPVSAIPWTSTDESFAPLNANEPVVGSGVWTLLEGRGDIDDPTSHSTWVYNLFSNINKFRWTVTQLNCSDYVDIEVQSGALAQAEAGWDQTNLCEDYTNLEANLPENTFGEWTVVSGFVKFEDDDHNDPEVRIYDISPGRNVLKWTLRFAGDGSQSTEDTVVIVNNKPTVASAGYDMSVCGDSAVFEAVEPIEGSPLWSVLSGGGSFADDTDPKTYITGLAPGKNVIKYEVAKEGCHSYDTVMVYNMEPSEAYAGEDQVVCADSAKIGPTAPKYGTGTWRVIKGAGKGKDDAGNYTDEISGNYVHALAPGSNMLVWEVQVYGAEASCIKRDTIEIINNEPSVSFAGHDRPVCTDTVSLSGNAPIYGEGTWTLISGAGEIADVYNENTLVTNLGNGKNRFRWTVDNNGCTSTSDVEISNDLIEAFAGYEQVNCADTAVLEANNPSPGEGTWGVLGGSGSANFDDNLDPYTNVRNLDKGENILTWTIQYNSCRDVSLVKITNNAPSKADAGDNKATCENSFVLGASNPEVGTGSWTIRSGGGKFEDYLNASTKVDSLKFGDNIFRWTVEYEGCNSTDDVQISYNKVDAQVGGDQDVCSDETFLEANSASPGVGTWTVVGGGSQAKFVDSHDPVTQVLDLAKGSNVLRWTINNEGCITSDTVTVSNHLPSTAYAGNTQELCEDLTTLDATPVAIGTGKWEILTGSAIIPEDELLEPKANISGLSKGENVLQWVVTSDNGLCTSVDDVLVINNQPSVPYAGKDEEYCSPDIELKAATPDFGTGRWSIIEGGGNFDDPALPNATISRLNEGLNKLRWTISQGDCSLYSEIEVLNNTPTTANAGPDISDCKDYAPLDGNVATQGQGFWTRTSGNAYFVDVNDPKTRVDSLKFGDNILMWNIQKGNCVSSDEIIVRNNIPDKAEAGTDKNTCEDYLTLNANDPKTGAGTWIVLSGNGDFEDPNSPTSIVRNLELGENKFKWVVAYGSCTTEDVVEIVSNKADPYAGEDDVSYARSYELKASNPGNLGAEWTVVAGDGEFDDLTYYNTRVDGLKEGVNTFRWTMDVNGCITYDDVSIEYKLVPDAAFKVDTFQGCYPLTVQFTNQSIGGSTYSWDFGDGKSSDERNPEHTFNNPGEYKVTLTAPGPDNVNGTFQMDILVYDHPVAEFSVGPEVVYIPGGSVKCYDQSVDAATYLWDFGDGNNKSTKVNPTYEYVETGSYTITLQVTSEFGCEDEIVKVDAVEVRPEGFVVFPNSFMPRPDGGAASVASGDKTTVFKPVYDDIETYNLQIFNRWGQLIYESENIEEGWNGFFNGQLSPQAVYVWKATGTFISGTVFNETGSVLLVR
ncbi:PKD domain-containing protein [Saccharicrinis sp. GN24d3]|uniref:PKD domain-containing protein n=1 Tax=Saccharicrinis sp. GN24d3 TaxID=3458416 RepID=UPI004036A37F